MSTQAPGRLQQLWIKLRHPHVYLVFDLAKEVMDIASVDADIRRIWDDKRYVVDQQVLARLGGFSSDSLLALRRLI
jgi:hypothetical protein